MKKHTLVLSLACLLFSGQIYALDLTLPENSLPDIGDPSSSVLSQTEETNLGTKLLRKLRSNRNVIEDPELTSWIRSLGNRLASNAPGARGNFYFLIIDDPTMNAFAMPGGVIAVHTGLILQTDNESELAAVISHEIAHVTQRHIARRILENKNKALVTGLGAVAGAIAASQSPELGRAVITSSVAAQAQNQLNFSRQAESEADRVGMRILTASGFNPQGMANFMEKLDRSNSDQYQDLTKYLRTHPLSIDRVSDTRALANKQGQRSHKDSADYLYAKAKLQAITQTRFRTKPLKTSGNYQRYAQAWKQAIQGNFRGVLQTLGKHSSKPQEAILIAKALNETGQAQQTIQLLNPILKNYPGEEALIMPLAEAYLRTANPAKAWQIMQASHISEQTSLNFLEKRQKVAQLAGKTGIALQTTAERYLRTGQYKHAKGVLNQALKSRDINTAEMARIQWMLKEVEAELAAEKE